MEAYTYNTVGWTNFLTATLLLILLWIVLNFIKRGLNRNTILGKFQPVIMRWVRYIIIVFEPLAITILVIIFVMINPIFHGLVIGGLFLAGFHQVQNYLNGMLVRFDKNIATQKEIIIGNLKGIIFKMERLGLQLKTDQGLHFISYFAILKKGYLLASSEETGGVYHLKLKPVVHGENLSQNAYLMNLLVTAPYLDWHLKPEILPAVEGEGQILVRVLVKEENHLHQLIALIKDWGYTCSIVNLKKS